MDFSKALEQVKQGAHIARSGWNGKGMYVTYQKGYPDGIPVNANTAQATGMKQGDVARFLPYLMLKTADAAPIENVTTAAATFVPWLASQTDILADDWEIVRPV